jgi:hypothetical protein
MKEKIIKAKYNLCLWEFFLYYNAQRIPRQYWMKKFIKKLFL